ncbi:MAG TPA: hypothetical protein DEB05_01010, partial [Firmicutes bacterium]|nr:hypothetical protein [Bacillota bacterium]
KGDKIVNMNIKAVDRAAEALEEIKYPESWAITTTGMEIVEEKVPEYVENIVRPILSLEGDKLPVSAFTPDGTVPVGTT